MWALGLSLFEIVAGRQPFGHMNSFQMMLAIRTWVPSLPSHRKISDDMKGLILSLYGSSFSLDFSLIIIIFVFCFV